VTQEKATDVWEEPASEAANLLVRRNRNVEISEEHIKNNNAGKEIAKNKFDRSFEYWEKSNYKEALEECDKAIELAPDWSEAHNLRGVILEEMDKPDESIMEYREAIRLDPDNKDAKKNLAYIDPVEAAIAARRTATTSITNCPRCKARVIPKPDGTCPSCQSIIRSGRSSSPSLYIEDPSIYGPIFKSFRQTMRQTNGIVPCSNCPSMNKLSLTDIENDIRKNIAKQKKIASGGTALILLPDWAHGAVCQKCVAYFCNSCVQEAFQRKGESRDQVLRVLLRYAPNDTPREVLESDLSSIQHTVLCPTCQDDFLLGVDHITD
jgi:tetratricopeptide (TPR) repeat protein